MITQNYIVQKNVYHMYLTLTDQDRDSNLPFPLCKKNRNTYHKILANKAMHKVHVDVLGPSGEMSK